MPRRLSILGSTGSIGVNALKVVENLIGEFELVCISGHKNAQLLVEQAQRYCPQVVAVTDLESARYVERKLAGSGIDIVTGLQGLLEVSRRKDIDLLLNALVGSAGMEPTIAAARAGVDIALSNKESLVMAGDIIKKLSTDSGSNIYPVDSEHSAIWQCLAGENKADIDRLILTGSGGPFRTRPVKDFAQITVSDALQHPNWSMGKKITIDSATMMNKGLEVIEAYWLFDVGAEQIEIVIHPQSIIHSMVKFRDGSLKAQLGLPDMKTPIQYALTYPRHLASNWEDIDLITMGTLTFEAPDYHKFPCLRLAFEALKSGGSSPAVLNVANEQAVYRFLSGEIRFTDIPVMIEGALAKHDWIAEPELAHIKDLESWVTTFITDYRSS